MENRAQPSPPGNLLTYLTTLDTRHPEFLPSLQRVIHSEEYSTLVSNLQGAETQEFINFLDLALDNAPAETYLSRKCLRDLIDICGRAKQLPSSYLIPHELLNQEDSPLPGYGPSIVYPGRFKDSEVAIRYLNIALADDRDKVYKAFYGHVVAWRRLSHPNILSLLGVSIMSPNELCMISEWMTGSEIRDYVRSHHEKCLPLLLDVAEGLHYLHSHDIVYGDLKGSNILIDNSGHARLNGSTVLFVTNIDASFSVSRGLTRWMAPELFGGEKINTVDGTMSNMALPTKESDVYSFAMVVIEVFTGRSPFPGFGAGKLPAKVMQGDRPEKPERAAELGLSDSIWEMVVACWQQDPSRRPKMVDVLHFFKNAMHEKTAISSGPELKFSELTDNEIIFKDAGGVPLIPSENKEQVKVSGARDVSGVVFIPPDDTSKSCCCVIQ